MAVALLTQYRIPAGMRDAFMSAARATLERAREHTAVASLRHTVLGGSYTDQHTVQLFFADAIARAAYLDAVVEVERAGGAEGPFAWPGTAVPFARSFLDEVGAAADVATPSPVISSLSIRVTPGRESEADAALVAGVELRRGLGIEAHLYTAQYAGAQTGLRYLEVHATSHGELAAHAAALVANRQRLGGSGPIPIAIAAGAMAMTEATVSTLVVI